MSALTLQSQVDGDRAVITLEGELDLATVSELEAEIARVAEAERAATLVIDLRELSFMDSSGLRAVLAAEARIRDAGGRCVLVRGPEGVQRVFEITRLEDRLTFVSDPADAEAGTG